MKPSKDYETLRKEKLKAMKPAAEKVLEQLKPTLEAQMNDEELSLRTLIDAKVLMYTSDDALDKTTAAIYAWHTRKLKEAVIKELEDTMPHSDGMRHYNFVKRHIAELEKDNA